MPFSIYSLLAIKCCDLASMAYNLFSFNNCYSSRALLSELLFFNFVLRLCLSMCDLGKYHLTENIITIIIMVITIIIIIIAILIVVVSCHSVLWYKYVDNVVNQRHYFIWKES